MLNTQFGVEFSSHFTDSTQCLLNRGFLASFLLHTGIFMYIDITFAKWKSRKNIKFTTYKYLQFLSSTFCGNWVYILVYINTSNDLFTYLFIHQVILVLFNVLHISNRIFFILDFQVFAVRHWFWWSIIK